MLYNPLDFILSSPNKVRVLRSMVHMTRPVSGRHAARLAGASAKARGALDELAELGVIIRREATGQNLYSFNRKNYLARALATLFRAEEQRTKSLLEDLRETLSSVTGVVSAAVFGSAARGTARPESDLDVYVIVKAQKHVAEATEALLEKAHSLQVRYGVRLAPLVVTRERWRAQLKDKESIAGAASDDGRVLIGEW